MIADCIPGDSWERQKAEARFREIAFHVAYHSVYATVQDCTTRFAYALAHSCLPIKNRAMFREWWAFTKGASLQGAMKKAKSEGRRPPEGIRGLIEAWEKSKVDRAKREREEAAYEKSIPVASPE